MSVSVRARTRTLALAVLGATLAATAAGMLPAVAAAPSTTVDPATLPSGDTPRIAWIDTEGTPRIVRPGRPDIPVPDGDLLHARGGYVVRSTGAHGPLLFVASTGRTRVLTRTSAFYPVLVSGDGRWLVLATDPYGTEPGRNRIQVRHLPDGAVVRTRTFPDRTRPMAADDGRVLLSRGRDTVSWAPVSNTVRVLARHGSLRLRSAASRLPHAASFGAREFTTRVRGHEVMRSMRTSRVRWATQNGEYVLSFSPDDRLVVTAARLAGPNEDSYWDFSYELRVRDARTGLLERTFQGNLGTDWPVSPVWEDDQTLLIRATSDLVGPTEDADGEYHESYFPDPAIIRCHTGSGDCEKVPVPVWTHLLQRKSN